MKQLFFVLFFVSFFGFSQTIEFGEFKNVKKAFLNEDTKEFYLLFKDSIVVIDINKKSQKKVFPVDNLSKCIEIDYYPISIKDKIYLIEGLGGKVYELAENTLKRIDNSFTHKMQIASTIFTHNNKIYRYGGYGFWSYRNFFTYFDTKTREWEILAPLGSSVFPEGSQSSTVNKLDNKFYIYSGVTLNPSNPLEFIINDKVWEFNFNSKSWNLLGTSKIDLSKYITSIPYGEKQVFLTPYSDEVILIDAANNSLKIFKQSSSTRNLSEYKEHQMKFFDGYFYCFSTIHAQDAFRLVAIPENEFFGDFIKEEKFYYNNEKIYYSISIVLLTGMSILIYFNLRKWNKKRNRIVVNDDSLMYKGKVIPFDDKSINVLNLLLYSTEEIIFSELIDINENKELNYAHKTRVVNTLIDEINFKLKAFIGIKTDLITFQKSELDKRIKVYTIDKSYFYLDKNKVK